MHREMTFVRTRPNAFRTWGYLCRSTSGAHSCQLTFSPDDAHPSEQITRALSAVNATVFYEKQLTTSDANGSGRIVIPKAVAEAHFPPLENQTGIDIDAIDSMGNAYFFRFRFWINNQSRMYLLEGASELQKRYNLRAEDIIIFAHNPNRMLVVAGRPWTETDSSKKSTARKMPGSLSRRDQKRSVSGAVRSATPKRPRKTIGRDTSVSLHTPHDFNPFRAPTDGVFRFLLNSNGLKESAVFVQSGTWTAVLQIKGEMYQAFFVSQNDALTAFNAAGYF